MPTAFKCNINLNNFQMQCAYKAFRSWRCEKKTLLFVCKNSTIELFFFFSEFLINNTFRHSCIDTSRKYTDTLFLIVCQYNLWSHTYACKCKHINKFVCCLQPSNVYMVIEGTVFVLGALLNGMQCCIEEIWWHLFLSFWL